MANKALLGVIAGLIIVGTFASFETLAGLYPDEFLATSTVTAEPAATDASAEMTEQFPAQVEQPSPGGTEANSPPNEAGSTGSDTARQAADPAQEASDEAARAADEAAKELDGGP